jgi:SpoVK/Ycf46/Vps4 family AAA+-type ATPase
MAATNIPWGLDSAILRRFDKKIYIPLPDISAREYLVRSKLKGLSENLTD